MAEDDIVVLGDWVGLTATQRTRSSGKQRVTFEISGEPILADLSEGRIGQPIADAIAAAATAALRKVSDVAAPSTLIRRARARKAFDAGEAWARKEYAGGQIGPMAPGQSTRKGNDSGRLARSFSMRFVPSVGQYIMNVAANRLTTEFRARRPGFVPWLATRIIQPALQSEELNRAVAQAIGGMFTVVRDARAAAAQRRLAAARQLLQATSALASEASAFASTPPPRSGT